MARDHKDCRGAIIDVFAEQGADVHVSTEPPIIPTPYDQPPVQCPHGVDYYLAPTSELIAKWARDTANHEENPHHDN